MEYNYEGAAYYIRYKPANTADCYAFETRTVTNDGEGISGEYCR
tara:strand:+ start:99520 stop:99651 length:132 start_codon:yes stop_codon:yes gene_type:complete